MADKKKSNPDADANPESDKLDDASDASSPIETDLGPAEDVVVVSDDETPVSDVDMGDADSEPDFDTDTDALEDPTPSDTDLFEHDVLLDTDPDADSVSTPNETEQSTTYADQAPDPAPQKIIERVVEKRGGFVPALIGGLVAACLGFFAARSDVLDSFLPDALKSSDNSEVIATLETTISDQSAKVSDLDKQVSSIQIPDQAPILSQLDTMSGQLKGLQGVNDAIDGLKTQLAGLDTRLTELEKRPISDGVSDAAIAAYERELAGLKDAIKTQRAEVEALIKEARTKEADARALEATSAAAAQAAANLAVVAKLHTSLDAGSPYAGLLAELTDAGVTVPESLTGPAEKGVVTMSALRDEFPALARDALAVARENAETTDRGIGAFLQRQLGARSVEPREGNDPDAVLSRAEAALTNGQLVQTLDEISALPAPAQAAFGDWVSQANTRLAAVHAADTLAQSLKTN